MTMNVLRSRLPKFRSPFSPRTTRYLSYSFYACSGLSSIPLGGYLILNTDYSPVLGNSMAPTLSPDYNTTGSSDRVLFSLWSWYWTSSPMLDKKKAEEQDEQRRLEWPWTYWLWPLRPWFDTLARGDVVVFRKPYDAAGKSIKRVVGLPGDEIIRVRKASEINKKLANKYGFAAIPRKVVVPQGHVWVEGDNWRDTFDSNDFGPISINLIEGRASYIIWPWRRWGCIPERPREERGRCRVIGDIQPDHEIDDAWKEMYNYR